MSSNTLFVLALFVFAVITAAGMVMTSDKPRTITYDCRLSEISPDFPPEVREQCRKMRANKI